MRAELPLIVVLSVGCTHHTAGLRFDRRRQGSFHEFRPDCVPNAARPGPEEVFEQEMEGEEVGAGSEATHNPGLDQCNAEIQQAVGNVAITNRCFGHLTIDIPYHFDGAEAPRLFSAPATSLQCAYTNTRG